MSDHIDRAAEQSAKVIFKAMLRELEADPNDEMNPQEVARFYGRSLADAGLLASEEHDAEQQCIGAVRALREAADEIDRDRRIHAGSVGESPARTAEQEGRDHGVSIAMKSDARWLRGRANAIEAGEQS